MGIALRDHATASWLYLLRLAPTGFGPWVFFHTQRASWYTKHAPRPT
jgi:hypothetical protein